MRAGRRDVLIEIEQGTLALDPVTGQQTRTWTLFRRAWAARATARTSERWAGVQRVAELDCTFEIEVHAAAEVFADTHRVREGGTVYELHGVTYTGRGRPVLLMCRARAERDPEGVV